MLALKLGTRHGVGAARALCVETLPGSRLTGGYSPTVSSNLAKPQVLIVTGPTAVGKTQLSLSLARALGGEIISADSVQVYKGLDVGSDKVFTAKVRLVKVKIKRLNLVLLGRYLSLRGRESSIICWTFYHRKPTSLPASFLTWHALP